MTTLTEKHLEVLRNLNDTEFLKPREFGAWDASHHSGTARVLAKRGLVEVRRGTTWGGMRSVNSYRRTPTGKAAFMQALLK